MSNQVPIKNETGSKVSKLQAHELIPFCTQTALLIRSGISYAEGIPVLIEEGADSRLTAALLKVNEYVQNHELFHVSLQKSGYFPDYLVQMVNIGETSGKIEEIMDAMAKYYTREQALKQRIRNAITYPVTLILLMSLVVLLLIAKVLPLFEGILLSLGSQMPTSVRIIMTGSNFLASYWLAILLCFLAMYGVGFLWSRTDSGKYRIDFLKMSFPGIKQIYKKIYAEKFSNAMAFMLDAAINMTTSIELSNNIINNTYMQKKMQLSLDSITVNNSLSEILIKTECFPNFFTRMLNVAQRTGDLGVVMSQLSSIYEEEVNTSLKKATSIIEPALVIVLSIIVGVILVSIMLPLINIMSSIG